MTDEKAANSHLAGLPAAARCEIAPVGVKVGLSRSNAGKPCITSLYLVLQAYKLEKYGQTLFVHSVARQEGDIVWSVRCYLCELYLLSVRCPQHVFDRALIETQKESKFLPPKCRIGEFLNDDFIDEKFHLFISINQIESISTKSNTIINQPNRINKHYAALLEVPTAPRRRTAPYQRSKRLHALAAGVPAHATATCPPHMPAAAGRLSARGGARYCGGASRAGQYIHFACAQGHAPQHLFRILA